MTRKLVKQQRIGRDPPSFWLLVFSFSHCISYPLGFSQASISGSGFSNHVRRSIPYTIPTLLTPNPRQHDTSLAGLEIIEEEALLRAHQQHILTHGETNHDSAGADLSQTSSAREVISIDDLSSQEDEEYNSETQNTKQERTFSPTYEQVSMKNEADASDIGNEESNSMQAGASANSTPTSELCMNCDDGDEPVSGEYNATLLSNLLYFYVSPLMRKAQKAGGLTEHDSFQIPNSQRMGCIVPKLERQYLLERQLARAAVLKEAKQTRKRKSYLNRFRLGIKHNKDFQYATLENPIDNPYAISESVVLGKALLKYQKGLLVHTAILRLFNTAIQAFPALLVARLLRLIESKAPLAQSIRAAALLITVLTTKMVIENQFFHNVVKYATQVRGSLTGIIFDKSLRVASNTDSTSSTKTKEGGIGAGGVLNLMQSDASILEATALQLHTIWDGPLQISIYTFLLYRYLGPSVLYGIAVLLTTIPINIIMLRILNKLSRFENKAKDARTKRTTEAISNMKLLKLQGWEDTFASDIERERAEELRRHVARGVVRALNQAISNAVPAIVLVVTLMAYAKSGRPIVASTIFTAISLFNQLRFPLFFYPMLIDSLANGKNALRRISTYLAAEEVTPYVQRLPRLPSADPEATSGEAMISMGHGNFLWSSRGKPALTNANFKVGPGEIVAVVGDVGSGKTALVKALLGELVPVPRMSIDPSSKSMEAPSVVAYGHTVYCSQEAWLPKGTIREAVLFGREYNEEAYMSALYDAGLDGDMVDLKNPSHPDGFRSISAGGGAPLDDTTSKVAASQGILTHDTDVGEGGSSLSGGQRARVALARALYNPNRESGVYLLDDPLAALDATVGASVFERVFKRLKRNRSATVFVTNDPSLPKRCDQVVIIGTDEHGLSTIKDTGTYRELVKRGHDLHKLDKEHHDVDSGLRISEIVDTHETTCNPEEDEDCPPVHVQIEIAEGYILELQSNGTVDAGADQVAFLPVNETMKQKLASTDDQMSTEAVPLRTYVSYMKSVRNPYLIAAMLASYLMVNGAQFYQQYVVAKWTEVGSSAISSALGGTYLRSLARAALVVSTFLWLRSYFLMKVGVRASRRLHHNMLKSVIRAPLGFFDATPSGQLISRFGKELDTVDRALPDGIGSVLFCLLQIFSSSAALAGVVTPGMLVPLAVVGYFYVQTMSQFRPAARDLKRAESKSRSPIYTQFKEALRGTETIRSLSTGINTWAAQHRALTDQNLAVFFTVKVSGSSTDPILCFSMFLTLHFIVFQTLGPGSVALYTTRKFGQCCRLCSSRG